MPHSWVFMFLHHRIRLQHKQTFKASQGHQTVLLSFGQQRAVRDLLSAEPRPSSGEGPVFEFGPDILQL